MAKAPNTPAPPEEETLLEDELIALKAAPEPDALAKMNIYQRMHHAAGMCRVIPKLGYNNFQRFKFVSHDQAALEARQVFNACGILFLVNIDESSLEMKEGAPDDGGRAKVAFLAQLKATATVINIDNPEDRYSLTLPAYALDTSDKAIGKAISYAKKYALLALVGLMLATGDDPDTDNLSVRGQNDANQRRDNGGGARQDAPQAARTSRQSNPRQSATPPQGQPPSNAPGANQAPKVPADKAKAQEFLDRHAEADLQAMSNTDLLTMGDSIAVVLACTAGDYVTGAMLKNNKDPERLQRTRVLNVVNRLTSVLREWENLRAAVLAKNDGNTDSAKAALRELKTAQKWDHIWELDPAVLQEAARQFADE